MYRFRTKEAKMWLAMYLNVVCTACDRSKNFFWCSWQARKNVQQNLLLMYCIKFSFEILAILSCLFFFYLYSFLLHKKKRRRWIKIKVTYHRNDHDFCYPIFSISVEATAPEKFCAWILHSGVHLFYLWYDIKLNTIDRYPMIIQSFCSNINCTTAVRTDRNGQLGVRKRIGTEKRRILLHPFHVENENKCGGEMGADAQKYNSDECTRLFMSTRMSSKWMKEERTYLCDVRERNRIRMKDYVALYYLRKILLEGSVWNCFALQRPQAKNLKIFFQILNAAFNSK